jgi:transposase
MVERCPERRRRSWTLDEKCPFIDESLEEGASITEVARRHDLNANQLFTWRRQCGLKTDEPEKLALILRVTNTSASAAEQSGLGSSGQREIMFAQGEWILTWSESRRLR